MRIADFRMIR
ncbi:hypothetical protein LINPERPRIM_LOCUS4999 [Linum perenne]